MTPRKEKALAALLTHHTQEEAAEAAGISPKTLRRYLKEPEFQESYRAMFAGLVTDATRKAQSSLTPALDTLREIAVDRKQGSNARIQASRVLLEYGLRLTEVSDIMEQLQELERWRAETDGEH